MTTHQKYALGYWLVLFFGGVGAVDFLLNTRHAGLTLSERVRYVKDSVPHGDTWWTAIWWCFAYWMWRHIRKKVVEVVEEVVDSKGLLS